MTQAITPHNKNIFFSASFDQKQELQRAIEANDSTKGIAILHNQPCCINTPLPNGELPLHYAVRLGCHELVKTIVRNSVFAVEAKDHQGLTPTNHAFLEKNPAMIATLLGSKLGKHFDSASVKSWVNKNQPLIDALVQELEVSRSISLNSTHELHLAAGKGDLETLQRVATLQNLDTPDSTGLTPLHYAVLFGKENTANWLIDRGSNLNLLTPGQKSLLHLAAIRGNDRILQTLLQTKKLNPNASDARGRTPLHFSIAAESISAIRALVQEGADPFIVSHGISPFDAMMGIATKQAAERDPLALDKLQFLLFVGIAAPWISHMCSGVPALDYVGIITEIGSALALFKTLKSTKEALAFLTLLPLAWMPGFNVLYRGWNAYRVGRNVFAGLAACWKNRFIEIYRPIRNAIIHSATGFYTWKPFVRAIQHTYEGYKLGLPPIEQMKRDWKHNMESDEQSLNQMDFSTKIQYCKSFFASYPWVSRFIKYLYHDYKDVRVTEEKSPNCQKIQPTFCEDKPLADCILDEALKPTECTAHASFIMNLSERVTCRGALRELAQKFHPDKLCATGYSKDKANKIWLKVNEALVKNNC